MVLILSCVLFLWACLGDSTSSVKSVHPVHQALGTVQTTESLDFLNPQYLIRFISSKLDLGNFIYFTF